MLFVEAYDRSLAAYQLTTGRQLWRTTLPAPASLGAHGQFLYCIFSKDAKHTTLEALDARNGHVVWSDSLLAVTTTFGSTQTSTSRFAEPTFVYQDNTIYVQNIHDQVIAIQSDNGQSKWTYQASIHQQDSSSNTLLWKGIINVQNGVLTWVSSDNTIHILNISTGQEILSFPPTSFAVVPTTDGQTLYTLPPPGAPTIQAFHLPDGRLLWNKPLAKGSWAQYEADGMVYLGAAEGATVIALRGSDGKQLWSYHASDNRPVINTFVTADGFGYLLQQDATLVCLRLSDGQLLWQRQVNEAKGVIDQTMDLIVEQDTLLLFDTNSNLATPFSVLNRKDGHLLWQLKGLTTFPFFRAGVLYNIENRGQVDAWRLADGKHLWSFAAPAGTTVFSETSDLLLLLSPARTLLVVRIADGRMLWHYP